MLQLSEGETIKPVENAENPIYPVIHRQYIYFLSSKESREKFMKNPIKYIRQPKPKPTVPIRIIIVGPPKSGKTTGERMFAFVSLKHKRICLLTITGPLPDAHGRSIHQDTGLQQKKTFNRRVAE